MLIGRLALALCVATLLGACSSQRLFDLPLAELKQRVGEVEISPIMQQSRGVGSERVVDGDTVAWKVFADGEQVFRIVATLAATGDNRSTLALTFEPGERVKAREAKDPDGIATIKNLYLIAQEEQILAHIERRSIDMGRIMAATMRATMANQNAIFGKP